MSSAVLGTVTWSLAEERVLLDLWGELESCMKRGRSDPKQRRWEWRLQPFSQEGIMGTRGKELKIAVRPSLTTARFDLRGFTRSRLFQILYCTVLYYTILYCTILYCTLLYCTIHYTILYYTALYYTLHYTISLKKPRSSEAAKVAARSGRDDRVHKEPYFAETHLSAESGPD